MTPTTPIPDDLLQFLDANVETVEQLEILRLLGETPDKHWTAGALAKEGQISPATIAAQLAALQARGLIITQVVGVELTCNHGPRTADLGNMLNRLLQLYKERPVTLIQMVYARAKDRLKAFADAFRIRKES